MSQPDSHTHEKADGLSSQNRNGRESHFRAFPPISILGEERPQNERVRPNTFRDWPPCPPIQRGGGERSRPGVSPFISALTVSGIPPESVQKSLDTALQNPMTAETFKSSVKSARDQVLKTLYSICFCENPLNETLWLKYADNHRGFVVTYDFHSNDTYLCGKEDKCKNCPTIQLRPSIYPVYYSDDKYDASLYAVAVLLKISMMASGISAPQELATRLDSCMLWEIERISLLKKACHRFDEEWRMIYPQWCVARPCIRLKPKSVIIGLRTPQYKERLIISAATIAGITDIQKIQINKKDELEAIPV